LAAPSRPEPAVSSTPAAGAGEIVVFTGPTLEGALAAARAAYGPRVRIVRAQRVRRGVRGLLGQVRYDVHAVVPETRGTAAAAGSAPPARPARPAGTTAPGAGTRSAGGGDLADALRRLVDAADASERSSAPEASWSWNGEAEVGALLEDVAALGVAARPDHPAGHPAPDLARHSSAGGTADVPLADATPTTWRNVLVGALEPAGAPLRRERSLPRPVSPAEPDRGGWSRAELRSIGVPPAVLRRLPIEDPTDDGGWRRALQEAIAAVVPQPAEPDADHPVVVSGHGLAGAVALLRAAVEDGAAPGTISFQGRRRPATPAALVEVLATCAGS
jgi:hypothetical protein